MVRNIMEDEEEAESIPFVGSQSMANGQKVVLESLEELLGVELIDYRKQRNTKEGFDLLRSRAEESGVFVVLQGNLGSHHTSIDIETFRGYSR